MGFLGEGLEGLFGFGYCYALAGKYHGARRAVNHFGRESYVGFGRRGFGYVGADETAWFVGAVGKLNLRVFGEVKHHRAGSACRSDVECSCQSPCHLVGMAYLVAPFGYRLCYAHHVGFLKRVGAKHRRRSLAGDYDKRCAIHHGVTETGNQIGGGRPRGSYHHAWSV